MADHDEISRVVLRNYKSIRHCDGRLTPVTFLVGPNGAGKSNFLEALRFLSYGLGTSLAQALDNRFGFRSIIHQGIDSPSVISFEIYFRLANRTSGDYRVQIGVVSDGPVTVIGEECSVRSTQGHAWFKVAAGVVTSNQGLMPASSEDKLYLVNASGLTAFEPVYRALSGIAVYNPVPELAL